MPQGFLQVEAPVFNQYRYGLFSAASMIEDASTRWRLGVTYDSDNCTVAKYWDARCSDVGFTVTLTRTANVNEFSVTFNPTAGPYEASVAGGAFQPFSNGGTFVQAGVPFTVVVRETTGLHRVATITGADPASAQGTIFTGTSSISAGNPPKAGDGLHTVTGDPFGVYAGIGCKTVGIGDAAAQASRRLLAGEQRAVEQWVWDNILTVPTAQLATGSTDAVPLKEAVGALENVLGDSYGGVGTIHSTAWTSAYMADRIQTNRVGNELQTTLGTKWAFGRGYGTSGPDDVTPPAESGEFWMYGTGQITIRRSPELDIAQLSARTQPNSTNDMLVIAERQYVVTAECPLWAVHVTPEGEDPVVA